MPIGKLFADLKKDSQCSFTFSSYSLAPTPSDSTISRLFAATTRARPSSKHCRFIEVSGQKQVGIVEGEGRV